MQNENLWTKDQLTEDQAKAMGASDVWRTWSSEQIVRFQLFQKLLCIPFDRFHEALEEVLKRPVYTHEFGLDYEGIVKEYLGVKEPPTLQEIIDLIPSEKRIVIGI